MSEEKIKQEKAETAPATETPASSDEASTILAEGDDKQKVDAKTAKKARVKTMPCGIAHVRSSFNNTTVYIADARGGVIAWSSAGKAGFRGSRKCTAFAATMVAQDAARQAIAKGMHEVEVACRVLARVANQPCVRFNPQECILVLFGIVRRLHTMVAVRAKEGESNG